MAKGGRKAKSAGRSGKNGSVDQTNVPSERQIASPDLTLVTQTDDSPDRQNIQDDSREIDGLRTQLEDVQRAFTESHGAFAEQLVAMTKQHDRDMQEALEAQSTEHQQQLDRLREEHRNDLDTLIAKHGESLADADAKHQNEIHRAEQQAKEAREAYIQERNDLQAQLDNALGQVRAHETQIASLRQQHEELKKDTNLRSSAVHEETITSLAQEKLQDIAQALGYKSPDYTFLETMHAAHHAKYAKLYKEILALR
ncbi:hypothetical protein MYAM1_003426 [Malassezia yamatoensis]|uniref:Uncharacterized protein n=1 Tax=Malassezia yamatoensis TaxID=253288 RepID=A0AAJ5YWP5_9BASI|nr:hypothetical protein MYAM1_003426 [Malassezia yamatoensis]